MRIALSIGAAFLIMNLATFVTYGSLAVIMGLEPPADGSPGQFFVSVHRFCFEGNGNNYDFESTGRRRDNY